MHVLSFSSATLCWRLKGILLNLLQAALRAAEQKRDGRHKETDAFCAELQVQCFGVRQ